MRYKYAKEKLRSIVRTLAIREGDVRSRLKLAARDIMILRPEHLPASLHADLARVKAGLVGRGPLVGPDGARWRNAVENTMSTVRNSTGRRLAELLYNMAWKVESASQRSLTSRGTGRATRAGARQR